VKIWQKKEKNQKQEMRKHIVADKLRIANYVKPGEDVNKRKEQRVGEIKNECKSDENRYSSIKTMKTGKEKRSSERRTGFCRGSYKQRTKCSRKRGDEPIRLVSLSVTLRNCRGAIIATHGTRQG
jgi:hypothetical protein